jgi:GDP-D-mannose 3',5'-epimerase
MKCFNIIVTKLIVCFLLQTATYSTDTTLVDDLISHIEETPAESAPHVGAIEKIPSSEHTCSLLMNKTDKIVITGAGGFIGGALTRSLVEQGFEDIRAVDIKPLKEWQQIFFTDKFVKVENLVLNLQEKAACEQACKDASYVFNLAADMGGMGFIESNKALCMLSVLINTHMLMAARASNVKRFFFASSACVYAAEKQTNTDVTALKEADAYPAMPEDGYGWEKLFSERMCRHFKEDFDLDTRIVRFHNVYGPYGTYDGGREKAPAAICRKVISAKLSGSNSIEIWGDGNQTRSFMFIDDCIEGILKIMQSDIRVPINLGSSELVSINQLVDFVEEISNNSKPCERLKRSYDLSAPKGVRGRNSDNSLIQEKLKWEPSTSLHNGLVKTYEWIHKQMSQIPSLY